MHEIMYTTHADVVGVTEVVAVVAHSMTVTVETGTPVEDEVDSTARSTTTVSTLVQLAKAPQRATFLPTYS